MGTANLFLDVLGDILKPVSMPAHDNKPPPTSIASYLLDVVFVHRLDR